MMSPRWMAAEGRRLAEPSAPGSGLLVDEEEVADEEGGLHRLGGDAEGLRAEGDDEDRDDDEVEERLHRGEKAGLAMVQGMRLVRSMECRLDGDD